MRVTVMGVMGLIVVFWLVSMLTIVLWLAKETLQEKSGATHPVTSPLPD